MNLHTILAFNGCSFMEIRISLISVLQIAQQRSANPMSPNPYPTTIHDDAEICAKNGRLLLSILDDLYINRKYLNEKIPRDAP